MLLGFWFSRARAAQAPQLNNETNIVASPTTTPETKKTIYKTPYIPAEVKTYSKEEVVALIKQYSEEYGIQADLPLRVALCESGYNWNSKNSNSTASGVFQYIASTWRNTEAGRQGVSVFDAEANVKMAIKSIASGGISNWEASKGCWNR